MTNVFISHSSEDKQSFVQTLVTTLHQHRHVVWYDTEAIRLGDSIPMKLSEGLENASRAIVVISRAYLASEWCRRELAALIMGHTNQAKDLMIIRLDGAAVPSIIGDIHRLELRSSEPASVQDCISRVLSRLAEAVKPKRPPDAADDSAMTALLMEADRNERFGRPLLDPNDAHVALRPENEGLILIKPGGTFYEPCLAEILRRIGARCSIRQLCVYDGRLVDRLGLFDQHYATLVKLARGEIPLSADDRKNIRAIYDHPEFIELYGVPYSDELVVPALTLTGGGGVTASRLSALWEEARAMRFHTNRPDGLNKIGYQKSVCPIELPGIGLRLVLNGFVPGYRQLFVTAAARTVAIHASSEERWQVIRDELVGGDSNPKACLMGSIRRDAFEARLTLDPADSLVNGQRNVCHSSATLFDGMHELTIWFDYQCKNTVVGRVCEFSGVSPAALGSYAEKVPDISWFTRGENLRQLVFDMHMRVTKQNLRTRSPYLDRVGHYARKIDPQRNLEASLAQQSALEAFVMEGLRLREGGDAIYQHAVAAMFANDDERRAAFYEIASRIRRQAQTAHPQLGPEVVAAAYRIAAGDLRLLRSRAYRAIENPLLFGHTVVAELPEQALECARRTEHNIIRDLRGKYSVEAAGDRPSRIGDHPQWQEALSTVAPIEPRSQTVAVVLCGGRSTRMASTIPKPVLPLRGRLLVDHVTATLRSATGGDVDVFAAVGFRADLMQKALGDGVRYLEDGRTLGLAFRVAHALEALAAHVGKVVIVYADMPHIAISTIAKLIASVDGPRTFSLVESQSELSGHIIKRDGAIQRIVQSRLAPPPSEFHTRDVGAYAFFNTPSLRAALHRISNDNVRGEYMFADIVRELVDDGWAIEAVEEQAENACGVNTGAELLELAGEIARAPNAGAVEVGAIADRLAQDYGLSIGRFDDLRALKRAIASHSGPVHFFNWWEGHWS